MHQTLHLMKSRGFPHLRRKALDALQVNLGYKCNQACFHCHVNASPDRKEMMSGETIMRSLPSCAQRRSPRLT